MLIIMLLRIKEKSDKAMLMMATLRMCLSVFSYEKYINNNVYNINKTINQIISFRLLHSDFNILRYL